MKRLMASVVAAVALLGAFAAPVQASAADDRLFAKLVRAEAPAFKAVKQKQMVKAAKATCAFIRSGWTVTDAVEVMDDTGFTWNESVAFVAGAVVFYCPEQEDNL
jgi:hypothetical protein